MPNLETNVFEISAFPRVPQTDKYEFEKIHTVGIIRNLIVLKSTLDTIDNIRVSNHSYYCSQPCRHDTGKNISACTFPRVGGVIILDSDC